ncbi:uncharacterized protein [Miscanthus floridulus]|uniref:uncharacterized protein n=1 Tax=Miscanthus floridulus TaxID=154761 RepID=UPI003458A811
MPKPRHLTLAGRPARALPLSLQSRALAPPRRRRPPAPSDLRRGRVCPPRPVVHRPAPAPAPAPPRRRPTSAAGGLALAPLGRHGPPAPPDLRRGRPAPSSALPGRWCAAPPQPRSAAGRGHAGGALPRLPRTPESPEWRRSAGAGE